eukprot:GEMP01043490.1.p1 GENE.GEMP01043490.1~~GEMP01043490.1.p1  ORF type:complete len:188 (+),score=16.87 GEMP01043490.1:226-789(+)
MVFPMPMMPQSAPSAWSMKMRSTLLILIVLQCVVGFVRFAELDIFGGFYISLTSLLGFYSLRNSSIDMSCLTTYGVISFISAIFDTILIISRIVHSPIPFFTTEMAWQYNVMHVILVAGPVLLASTASICYQIYKDSTELLSGQYTGQDDGRYGNPRTNYGSTASLGSDHQFVPFQGMGRPLGTVAV